MRGWLVLIVLTWHAEVAFSGDCAPFDAEGAVALRAQQLLAHGFGRVEHGRSACSHLGLQVAGSGAADFAGPRMSPRHGLVHVPIVSFGWKPFSSSI